MANAFSTKIPVMTTVIDPLAAGFGEGDRTPPPWSWSQALAKAPLVLPAIALMSGITADYYFTTAIWVYLLTTAVGAIGILIARRRPVLDLARSDCVGRFSGRVAARPGGSLRPLPISWSTAWASNRCWLACRAR